MPIIRPITLDPKQFNALPAPVAGTLINGVEIVTFDLTRVGLLLFNTGAANVYYFTRKGAGNNQKGVLPAGAAINFLPEQAPVNSIYALGDAGHDLRVTETVRRPVSSSEVQV
jgi:hypothetical protein